MNDITRYRADDFLIRVTLRNADGSLLDVDGCTFLLTVSQEEDPTSVAAQLFQSVGVIEAPSTNGVVQFQVVTVDPGRYFFDFEMTDTTGKVKTVYKGSYIILQDITKGDEVFEWTPPALPADGSAVPVLGTEMWWNGLQESADSFTYETRDTRRVIRIGCDMAANSLAYRDLWAYGPDSPRPRNQWQYGWQFKAWSYVDLANAGVLCVSGGQWDYVEARIECRTGTAVPVWSGRVGQETDSAAVPDNTGWPAAGWYVIGVRITAAGVIEATIHPEANDDAWTALMDLGVIWNPTVPYCSAVEGIEVDPENAAAVVDLWKYEWRKLI